MPLKVPPCPHWPYLQTVCLLLYRLVLIKSHAEPCVWKAGKSSTSNLFISMKRPSKSIWQSTKLRREKFAFQRQRSTLESIQIHHKKDIQIHWWPKGAGTRVRYLNQQPLGEWSGRGDFLSEMDRSSWSKLGVLAGTQWSWGGLCPVATAHAYGLEANFGGEFKGLCGGNGHPWHPTPVPHSLPNER